MPTSARPGQDVVTGQDELGRTVYKTVTGERYTMPERPQSSLQFAPGRVQGPPAYAAPQRMQEMGDYTQSLRGMQGGYSSEDLKAAGYTPQEIAAFSAAGRPSAPSQQETNRDRQEFAPVDVLQEADPTLRAGATARVQDALMN